MKQRSRIIRFPYKKYKGQYYPIVTIQIKGSTGLLQTEAYIDSGASISIFLSGLASAMGIDIHKGKITYVMVGDGSYIPAYLHTVFIKLGNISFPATIGFSSHLGAEFNLLGQKDIFDRFKVCFDRSKKTISFYPY